LIIKQFYLNCLAHASYLIADETTQAAVVVDPQRDIQQYLDFSDQHGVHIAHVVLTHLHADFVAGHLELRDRTAARIYLGASARAEYAFTKLADGNTIDLGRVQLRALETPGHTAESISLLVFDLDRSATAPYAVLTGDTLFVGDVGRPDLRVALGWSASDLGGLLYDSLQTKLLTLPDTTLVYPAHGAGSLCGRALSRETVSTIGDQRRLNYALQPMTKKQFVDLVTADQPDAPAYFTYDAVLNSLERPTLDRALERELKPLSLETVLAMDANDAQLLDTRDPGEFAAAHLARSINIGLGGQYATWAGTILDHARPIVIIADPGRETEAALRLGRIGFDNVVGYLEGGLASVASRPDLTKITQRLSPERARDELTGGRSLGIDVRTPTERREATIDGTLHIPLNHLVGRVTELPTDRALVLFCAGGYRSSIAASLLQHHGLKDVQEIAGGLAGWEQAHLPVTPPRGSKPESSPEGHAAKPN
jgi:glyoxylase-like metal-dependent hydrolase (beta-lactamase superfamily II)/rhodanese-related sulfurtransferase